MDENKAKLEVFFNQLLEGIADFTAPEKKKFFNLGRSTSDSPRGALGSFSGSSEGSSPRGAGVGVGVGVGGGGGKRGSFG